MAAARTLPGTMEESGMDRNCTASYGTGRAAEELKGAVEGTGMAPSVTTPEVRLRN